MTTERSHNPHDKDVLRERYSELSPLERNQELFHLFLQLPYSISHEDPFAEITEETVEARSHERYRRNQSQLREVLTNRVAALLSLTKTTPQLQHHITSQYGRWYDRGVTHDHEKMFSSPMIQKLFNEYEDIEGIFNDEDAKEIERAIYKNKIGRRLELREIFPEVDNVDDELTDFISAVLHSDEQLRKENPEKYQQQFDQKERNAKKEREFMRQWPQAFYDLHGDEM